MRRDNYTPEEIAEMHDRNENFHGSQANIAKILLYNEIKAELVEFMQSCDEVRLMDGFAPNAKEKHDMLWLELRFAATLDKEETAALTAIMNKTDGVVLAAAGNHIRISLQIDNIWLD